MLTQYIITLHLNLNLNQHTHAALPPCTATADMFGKGIYAFELGLFDMALVLGAKLHKMSKASGPKTPDVSMARDVFVL